MSFCIFAASSGDISVSLEGFMVTSASSALRPRFSRAAFTAANSYVPVSLRDFRYDTYLVGATDWNDTPLNLFTEWVAYTNGTEAGVTLVKEGKWNAGWRDTFGSLEFTVYAFAVAMAAEVKDPAYFSGYPQFRVFLKWNAERALGLVELDVRAQVTTRRRCRGRRLVQRPHRPPHPPQERTRPRACAFARAADGDWHVGAVVQ